jgi:hypothetical protein
MANFALVLAELVKVKDGVMKTTIQSAYWDKLEERGFISAEDDGVEKTIWLTDDGKDLLSYLLAEVELESDLLSLLLKMFGHNTLTPNENHKLEDFEHLGANCLVKPVYGEVYGPYVVTGQARDLLRTLISKAKSMINE